jgi:hypothetical protein
VSYKSEDGVRSTPTSGERFLALAASYGANPARWPQAERDAAEKYFSVNAQARVLLAEAAKLDDALDGAARVEDSSALEARIMAAFDAGSGANIVSRAAGWLRDRVWPGAPLWQPATAFALSLMIGVGAGFLLPFSNAAEANTDRGASVALGEPLSLELTGNL